MASGLFCTLSCPHCGRTIGARFSSQTIPCPHCNGVIDRPVFPVLDNATNKIQTLQIVPYSAYLRISLDDRRPLFTVAGIESVDVLVRIRSILAKCLEEGGDLSDFERQLKKAFGKTPKISPEAVEKVFRGCANRA